MNNENARNISSFFNKNIRSCEVCRLYSVYDFNYGVRVLCFFGLEKITNDQVLANIHFDFFAMFDEQTEQRKIRAKHT
jgi:hypothetical protein